MSGDKKEGIQIDNLIDIRDVVIDPTLNKAERIQSFVSQIRNPLCYRCGEYVVQIAFSEGTGKTMESCFEEYLKNL